MISIAMTTFNGEKYIREQINSILNQTYKDFELIIVDDCSQDNTYKILEEYRDKNKNIFLYKNIHNVGFKKNFEIALSKCNGTFIALADQDDIWLENHLEILLKNIGNYDISAGNALFIDSDGNSLKETMSEKNGLKEIPTNENVLYRILCTGNIFQGASMLIRKSFFINNEVLPIPETIKFHDAWFSCCAAINSGITYTNEVVELYRQHGNNATSDLYDRKSFFKKIPFYLKLLFQKDFYKTDKLEYIEFLRRRFKVTDYCEKILTDCEQYIFSRQKSNGFKCYLKGIKVFIENYKKIYCTNSYKKFISRFLLFFL